PQAPGLRADRGEAGGRRARGRPPPRRGRGGGGRRPGPARGRRARAPGRVRRPARVTADDDDDWVGTPPEGRYSRDRAHPEFWWRQRPVLVAGVGIVIALVVLLVVVLLS